MITEISASILAADPLNIEKAIYAIKKTGLTSLHIDIMDGHYVDNLALNFDLISAIEKTFPELNLDIHLMVSQVDKALDLLKKNRPRSIFFHPKTSTRSLEIISRIQENSQAGIAINPDEKIEYFFKYLPKVDHCLVMSVVPGRCGRPFQESALTAIQNIYNQHPKCQLSIDGGINLKTLPKVQQLNIPIQVVMGSGLVSIIDNQEQVNQVLSYIHQ
ncbi:MAG: hypothetical protein VX737_01860 [Pseudomonadota bacterium]|nr:hypothetical protein [Pseudomonadota bacterium]